MQRLGHMRRGLVALDHRAVAVDGADILVLPLVVAPDIHLLAGKMVDGQLDLEAGVARID